MQVREHQGKSLKYLTVEPDGYDRSKSYPVVVLLHGFGAGMGDLAGLASAISPDQYLYVCPNGPLSVQIGPGMEGSAWTPPAQSGTPEDARRAEELLAVLFDEIVAEHGAEPGRIVLGGFSQGGMMTYRCGLPRPGLFAGLIALSARVADPEGLRARLPKDKGQPIFIAHGTEDSLISADDARESRRFLEAEGYAPEYREYTMGHEITQDVLSDLVPWVTGTLETAQTNLTTAVD